MDKQLQQTTLGIIEQFGTDIIIQKKATVTYDRNSGTSTTTTGATHNIKGVIESYTSEEIQGLVQVGDLKVITGENNIDYDIANDKLTFNGNEYSIINIEEQILQTITVSYTLQVRK